MVFSFYARRKERNMTEYPQVGDAVRVLPFDEIDREVYGGIIDSSGGGYYGLSRSFINEMSSQYEVLYIRIADQCVYDAMGLEGAPKYVYKLRTEDGDPIPHWWTDNMLAPVSVLPAETMCTQKNTDDLFGFLLGKEASVC